MTIILFSILLLALIFILIKKNKHATICLLISVILFWLIGSGIIPRLLLNYLRVNIVADNNVQWREHNIIVLLGAGNIKFPEQNIVKPNLFSYARIMKAAQLYFVCKQQTTRQCHIIVSGGDPLRTGYTEANIYQSELQKLQIQPRDIILENNSRNTYQNAQFTAKFLTTHHYDQVFLVTSGLHMKRSLIYFAHFGTHPIPVNADYLKAYFSALPLGYNFAITDWAVHEYIGIARLYIYNYLRLN